MNEHVLAAIRKKLHERGLDAYIAHTPSNMFYATGSQSYCLMQSAQEFQEGSRLDDWGLRGGAGEKDDGHPRRLWAFGLWPEIRDASMFRNALVGVIVRFIREGRSTRPKTRKPTARTASATGATTPRSSSRSGTANSESPARSFASEACIRVRASTALTRKEITNSRPVQDARRKDRADDE